MPDGCNHTRLSSYLDDELPEEAAVLTTRHLADCAGCRTELDELRRMRQALRSLPPLPGPSREFFDDTAELALVAIERRRRSSYAAAGAGALTALLGATIWLAGADDAGTVVPPVERFVVDHSVRNDHGGMVTPVNLGR